MFSPFAARPSRGRLALACAAAFAWPAAHAASTDAARSATTRGGVERAADAAAPASAVAIAPPAPVAGETLSAVSVTAQRQPVDPDTPAVVTSITREQIESHTNVTTEDALKYAPNLMVRKRYIGDRNSVFAGRDFNELQSARGNRLRRRRAAVEPARLKLRVSAALVADSAGRYRARRRALWPLFSAVSGQLDRLDRAAHDAPPGKLEASLSTQFFTQRYHDGYGFADSFGGNHQTARIANRVGRFWFALSLDRLENNGQPMQYASPIRHTTRSSAPPCP